jgi:peptidyl-dipeptidase Dcp
MTKCKKRSRSFALLSDFSNDIRLNPTLFARVKAVYDSRESLKLSPEQVTLLDTKVFLEITYRKRRKQITRNRQRTIKAESAIWRKYLAETNAFEMHLTDEKTLPDYPKELSKPLEAKEKGKEGWIFTLDHPSYVPFMTYADNRELRKN